jgi:hypothetical protein
VAALKQTNPFAFDPLQKVVSGPFHLFQLFVGIRKEVHPQAAELWLVVDCPIQKGHLTRREHQEQISVAAGNGLPPGQGTKEPDFLYFRMPLGELPRRGA